MCGRFRLEISPKDIIGFYKLIEEIDKKYKIQQDIINASMDKDYYPGSVTPVLTDDSTAFMKWGFPLDKKLVFNGRSESIDEKIMFKNLIQSNKCIVPASLFYEWNNKRKFTVKTTEPYFFMAGLYRNYKDDEGKDETRVVILTTDADKDMQKIHTRMPVIIEPTSLKEYLNPELSKADFLNLLKPWNKGLSIELADNEQLSFFCKRVVEASPTH